MTEEEIGKNKVLGKMLKSAVISRRPLGRISELMVPGVDAVKLKRMCLGILKGPGKAEGSIRGADPLPSPEEAQSIKSILMIGIQQAQSSWLKMSDDLAYLDFGTVSDFPQVPTRYNHVTYNIAVKRVIDELPPADIYVLQAVNRDHFKKFPFMLSTQLLQATFISMLKIINPEQNLTMLRPKFAMLQFLQKFAPEKDTTMPIYLTKALEKGSIGDIPIKNSRTMLTVFESLQHKERVLATFLLMRNMMYTLEIVHKIRSKHQKS